MALIGSVSGSHTKLADGTTYIEAGSNITIVSGSGNDVQISATDTNTTYTAGDGLDLSGTVFSTDLHSGGGLKIESTELAVDDAIVATITGSQFSGNVGVTGSLEATVEIRSAGSIVATGSLSGSSVQVTGIISGSRLEIPGGEVNADTGVFTGAISGSQVQVTGVISGSYIEVTGSISADTGIFTGAISGSQVQVTGVISGSGAVNADTGNFTGAISGSQVQVTGVISGSHVEVTGSVSADKGIFTSDLSGSLQTLADGTAYLQPGNVNITITSASAGHVLISSIDTNTTYTAGNGLDLSGTTFSTDLKAGSGLIIDSTELSIDHAIIPATSGAIFSGDVGITGSLSTTGHAEVGALEVGGGFGSTGVTITGAGAINTNSSIKVGGGAIQDSGGNNNILISGGSTTITGDLTANTGIKISSNAITASDGGKPIIWDTSDNVTVVGNLTGSADLLVVGNITGSNHMRLEGELFIESKATNTRPKVLLRSLDLSADDASELRFQKYDSALADTGTLGEIYFDGAEQTAGPYGTGASIIATVDGTWTDGGSHPSKITFATAGPSSITVRDIAAVNTDGLTITTGASLISPSLSSVDAITGSYGSSNIWFREGGNTGKTEPTSQTFVEGELHVSGAIGICVTPDDEATDNEWVKFATANFSTSTFASANAIFFVQLAGRYDGYYATNSEAALIYVSLNNQGHSTGPHFNIDLIGQNGYDPDAQHGFWSLDNFVLTYDVASDSAEIWIQAELQNVSGYQKLYGTLINGSTRNSHTYGGDWHIETNQTWVADFTSLGTDQIGSYRSFIMDKLQVSGSVESLYFNGFEKIKQNSNITSGNGIYWPTQAASNAGANTLLEATNQQYDIIGPAVATTSTYWYTIQATPASTAGNVRRHTDGSSANNFTGQHNTLPVSGSGIVENLVDNVGLIVRSIGEYCRFDEPSQLWVSGSAGITISEALPRVELTTTENDKSAFGVVSNMPNEYLVNMETGQYEQDQDGIAKRFGNIAQTQVRINALGEGAIWIVNTSGNLENGDYITTSALPGYGMKQDDDLLHNYTVAKITQDCNFDTSSTKYKCEEITIDGQTYTRAFVGCTYHCG